MKNILLLVHDDDGQEARLQAALDLTRAFEGHLTCLDVAMMPYMAGDYWDGGGAAMLLAEEREKELANRTRLEARIRGEGVNWTWIDASGGLVQSLKQASLLSELIVINRRLDIFPHPEMAAAASELVVSTGKPVLAVPGRPIGLNVAGRVLVAWNGSAEADAALQAAVPLLGVAAHVMILEVSDGSVSVPAEEAASFLSRYGIHALVVRESKRGRDTEEVILSTIQHRQIDYVVMGAFGHSRLMEALFGGVSRKLLNSSPVPLFMAH